MLEGVFDLTAQFLWYRRSNARRVRDLEAVDCVMSKIGKQRGLVGPSYRFDVRCSTVDTRARLPISRGDPLLEKSRWSRGHVLENSNNVETEKRCQEQKSGETRAFRYPQRHNSLERI